MAARPPRRSLSLKTLNNRRSIASVSGNDHAAHTSDGHRPDAEEGTRVKVHVQSNAGKGESSLLLRSIVEIDGDSGRGKRTRGGEYTCLSIYASKL